MKKKLLYSLAFAIVSCSSKSNSNDNKEKELVTETNKEEIKTEATSAKTAQITVTYKGQKINMNGKIKELCDDKHECSSTIIAKQKNGDGNILFDLSLILRNKISAGTYPLQKNYFGTFIDAVNVAPKGAGETQYTSPTTYKQKGGSITITKISDKLVSGSFTLSMYNLADTTITETVEGTITDLEIQKIEK